jgi:hypothetical protein
VQWCSAAIDRAQERMQAIIVGKQGLDRKSGGGCGTKVGG